MLSLLRIESLLSSWLAFVCKRQRARPRARHLQRGNLGCSQAGMSVYSDTSELHISNRPNQRGEDRRGCSASERIGASESVNQ